MELKSLTELNKLTKAGLLNYIGELTQLVNKTQGDSTIINNRYMEVCSQRDDLLIDNHKLTSESRTFRENYDNKCTDYDGLVKDYVKIKSKLLNKNITIFVLLGIIVMIVLLFCK
jgi:hypothetical protein